MAPSPPSLVLAALLAIGAAGCETRPAGDGPGEGAAVFDDLGRTIALARPPRRIASLAPGFTEILFAIGCGDRVAVRDRWSDFPRAAREIPAIDGLSPSAEHVAGFAPDLVLLYAADRRFVAPLERLGIPVAVFNPGRFDEVAEAVRRIGLLSGCAEPAAALAGEMRRRKERLEGAGAADAAARPLVYVQIDGADPARPWTAGPGSFVHEIVELAGGRNAAAQVAGAYAQVGAESLIRMDPDWILLLDVESGGPRGGEAGAGARRLAERPGWHETAAVRSGRIIDWIDRDLVSRPGPRLVEGLELLAEALSR
jgi:iron complex transport system substrate-binding protein